MSRRSVSPLRTQGDPRDTIIRKLKEDIIMAKGREKQQAILETFLLQLLEKNKLTKAETVRSEEEGKTQLEASQRQVGELKREAEVVRTELRKTTNQVRDAEEEQGQLKRMLDSRQIELDNHIKEAIIMDAQEKKLIAEHVRLRNQQEEGGTQISRGKQNGKIYEGRIAEVGGKLREVQNFIGDLQQEEALVREQLRNYEIQNGALSQEIQGKDDEIDLLERQFTHRHEEIKELVDSFIELENRQERMIKQTQHNLALLRTEANKATDLNTKIKKTQRAIGDRCRDLEGVREESRDRMQSNDQFRQGNTVLAQDIASATAHMQNLFRANNLLREEMEEQLRQDQSIIAILRRKRIVPT